MPKSMSMSRFLAALCLLSLTLLAGPPGARADLLEMLRVRRPAAVESAAPENEAATVAAPAIGESAEFELPVVNAPTPQAERAAYESDPEPAGAPPLTPPPRQMCPPEEQPCPPGMTGGEYCPSYWQRMCVKWKAKKGYSVYPPCPPYHVPNYGYFPTCWRPLPECIVCPPNFLEANPSPAPAALPPPAVPPPPAATKDKNFLKLGAPIPYPNDSDPPGGIRQIKGMR